ETTQPFHKPQQEQPDLSNGGSVFFFKLSESIFALIGIETNNPDKFGVQWLVNYERKVIRPERRAANDCRPPTLINTHRQASTDDQKPIGPPVFPACELPRQRNGSEYLPRYEH